MKLHQQIVQDRVEEITQFLRILDNDEAFLRFAHSLITGQSIHVFDPNDLVDGGQDKQIDVITIEEDSEQATVYMLQAKNTTSFSSNALIQMRNGLNWIFNKPRVDIKTLSNISFRDKIFEYRSLQSGIGPSNIQIVVAFATNGLSSTISDEFQQELKTIKDEYDNNTFADFRLEVCGAAELVALLNAQERQRRSIDDNIRIRYDANNPSLIRYYSQDLKGLVCTSPASEIARLVNNDQHNSIFDLNIRRFLGTSDGVNKDIQNTCTKAESSYQFWFLNNGITIVCDRFDAVTDPDVPQIKIENMQIVNGCQTATMLALAQKEGNLAPDVRVLLRIYETADDDLVNKIVLTTNNQNRVSSRNLRANDPIQIDMENAFSIYNYYYERKPRQFVDSDVDASRIIPNEQVAQSYLAIALKIPSDARRRKYKVWGQFYNKIFSGQTVESYIIMVLIARYTSQWLRTKGFSSSDDETTRKIAKNGAFHVARIAAYLWRGDDEWRISEEILKEQLQELENDITILDSHLEGAFQIFEDMIQSDDYFLRDLDRTLKSHTLDEVIDRKLYTQYRRRST